MAGSRLVALGLDREIEEFVRHLEMVSAARGFEPEDADGAPEQAAVHEVWLHLRALDDVALLSPDGALLTSARGAPLVRPPADMLQEAIAAVRPSARAVPAADGRCRIALLVPLRNWQGRVSSLALGVLDPRGARWRERLEAEAGRATLAVLDEHGHELARAGPPSGTTDVARAALARAPLTVVRREPAGVAALSLRTVHTRLAVLAPAVLGISLLLAWGVARSVKAPLLALGRAAERIAGGDLERPVPAQGRDEVGRLAAALEDMRRALQVRERDRLRGLLLRKLIGAQEEERKRIARELHDETCQTLSALAMRLDAAAGSPGPVDRRDVADARALAGEALDEVHHVIHALRPSMLDDLGLADALRWTAARVLAPAGVSVQFEAEDDAGAGLPADVQTALYRAAQEALANVARHARAEHALIQIGARDGDLVIEIEDDGDGFDAAEVETPAASGRGLGLLGMRERLELAGGSATVTSSPGKGTRVVLRAPQGVQEGPWLASAS